MLATPSGFSILAMIGILCSLFFFINSSSSIKSSACLTKESAIQSTPSLHAKIASSTSFSVNAG